MFHKKIKSFSDVVNEKGNPFEEETNNLLVLDTNNVEDPTFVSTIGTLHQQGNYQFLSFTERLEKTVEVHSANQSRTILFSTSNKSRSNTKTYKKILKYD